MDAIADDDRIIEALRLCVTPPTEDQLCRLLAALRDTSRAAVTTTTELHAPPELMVKWEFIHDDGSFYERIDPDELPAGDV